MENDPKPEVLYHGSTYRGITVFEPRKVSVRDPQEGPVVFASPDPAIALIFALGPHVPHSGRFDETPYAVIVRDREDYIKEDRGCSLYLVPSDTFVNDPDKGLGPNEWVSRESVPAIREIDYPSALDAALERGVQVYFVDRATDLAIRASDDFGCEILKGLQSENQRRGVNVREL